jgi:hypothetical protein
VMEWAECGAVSVSSLKDGSNKQNTLVHYLLRPIMTFSFRPKRSYGMGFVQLFVAKTYVTLLLQRPQSYISKWNKGNQPEHNLEEKTSVDTYV